MAELWDQARLQQYCDNAVEENSTLEYKAAASLGTNNDKKKEITKDISALANSAGGTIIYGIREYQTPGKEHLPEALDGIDRRQFSKEWLDQVINNIQPHLKDFLVHPVSLATPPDHVAYVVEVPQSTTAHQATDFRYYKRSNVTVNAMEDYEIRDVMNRASKPNVEVDFDYSVESETSRRHDYALNIVVRNLGIQVIHDYKLKFTFPNYDPNIGPSVRGVDRHNAISVENDVSLTVLYESGIKLFPTEEINVGKLMGFKYYVNETIYQLFAGLQPDSHDWALRWTLYADDMMPKHGIKLFKELQNY